MKRNIRLSWCHSLKATAQKLESDGRKQKKKFIIVKIKKKKKKKFDLFNNISK